MEQAAGIDRERQFEVTAAWRERGLRAKLAYVVALAWSIYTLAYLTKLPLYLGVVIHTVAHRAICGGLICILVFLLYPPKQGMARDRLSWYDILPILFIIAGCGYIIGWAEPIMREATNIAEPFEMILAILVFLSIIEASRRTIGSVLTGLIILFFFYAVYSNHFPGFLHSTGFSYPRMLGWMYLSIEGSWGLIIGVVSTVVAGFIIFGGFLRASGASQFFSELALATVGFMRGGAAKAAIIASSLFGTISGSIAANVATTGQITIPLMKETGYEKNFAGAIEATASTGGMFMPPVMGATAFLIAEFLQISYWSVCVAAFLPAVIFYLVLFAQVDLEAAKTGLKGLPRQNLPSLRKTLLGGWQYLLPFVLLIFLLGVLRYSAQTSIMYTLGALIVVSSFKKESRPTPKRLSIALEDSARGMLPIAPLCTAVGILVGSLHITGAGTGLTSELLGISGGSLVIILFMAGAAAFVLGMGMTTVSVYILTVVLLAPALIRAGVEPIAAHMFLFYFGCLSFITPPVCVAAYIAAGISGGNPWTTGFRAVRLGVAAFIVPWAFIFNPGVLIIGSATDILLAFAFVTLGAVCIGVAFAGHLFTGLRPWQRAVLPLAGISMFIPSFVARVAALIVIATVFFIHFIEMRRAKAKVAVSR